MWNRGWTALVLAIIMLTFWQDSLSGATRWNRPVQTSPPLDFLQEEAFEPAPRALADAILSDFRGTLKIPPLSVVRATMVDPREVPPTRQNMFAQVFRRAEAYEAGASAVPRLEFVGGAVAMGKRVHARGRGETKEAASTDARKGVDQALEALQRELRFQDLMMQA